MPITLTVKGAIAEILFDHPPVNAFDTKGWESIPAMVYEAAANEDVKVILPDMGAGCSMADMANLDQTLECWEQLTEVCPDQRIVR